MTDHYYRLRVSAESGWTHLHVLSGVGEGECIEREWVIPTVDTHAVDDAREDAEDFLESLNMAYALGLAATPKEKEAKQND